MLNSFVIFGISKRTSIIRKKEKKDGKKIKINI